MALSTYWVSQNRKDLAEKAIVARREREANRERKCKEVASYHQELALKSSKYRSLEGAQTVKNFRIHEESRVREDRIRAEKEKIENRRQKLARVLAVEQDQYMKELENLSKKERVEDPWNIHKLKMQIEELQRKRKEAELNMQRKYTYHLFTAGGAIAHEKGDEQIQKEATESWQQRKEELEKLNLEKLQKEQERIRRLESEQSKACQEAREVELQQLQEQEKWSGQIQSKVERLNAAQNDTKKLKFEKNMLIGHLENLVSLQQKRQGMRDIQRKGIVRIQSLWQAKEKLRRMLVEVKHGIECDMKLLERLSDLNNSVTEDTALALLDLNCVADGREKLKMQMALEGRRELEAQQLYHEEATKVWESKKEQWIMEAIARDEIMEGIIKNLVNQIQQKIEVISEEQKKLIEVKEKYLQEIDDTNKNVKGSSKTLAEKYEYFNDRASRLNEELESIHSARRPESSSSRRYAFT